MREKEEERQREKREKERRREEEEMERRKEVFRLEPELVLSRARLTQLNITEC